MSASTTKSCVCLPGWLLVPLGCGNQTGNANTTRSNNSISFSLARAQCHTTKKCSITPPCNRWAAGRFTHQHAALAQKHIIDTSLAIHCIASDSPALGRSPPSICCYCPRLSIEQSCCSHTPRSPPRLSHHAAGSNTSSSSSSTQSTGWRGLPNSNSTSGSVAWCKQLQHSRHRPPNKQPKRKQPPPCPSRTCWSC